MIWARRNLNGLALIVALLLAGAACGDDDGGAPESQPAPGVTAFAEGDFSDLPLPPLAEPAGERSEEDDIVTRSYFVRNRTPEEVLDFYAGFFEDQGVDVIASPAPAGTEVWRGRWLWKDRELLISATPAPTAAGEVASGNDVLTQMSLELWPTGAADHEDPSTTSTSDGT